MTICNLQLIFADITYSILIEWSQHLFHRIDTVLSISKASFFSLTFSLYVCYTLEFITKIWEIFSFLFVSGVSQTFFPPKTTWIFSTGFAPNPFLLKFSMNGLISWLPVGWFANWLVDCQTAGSAAIYLYGIKYVKEYNKISAICPWMTFTIII